MSAPLSKIRCEKWTLELNPGGDESFRQALIKDAMAAVNGETPGLVRRSRYAATYRNRVGGRLPDNPYPIVFLKLFDPPRGLATIGRITMGSRARRAANAAQRLKAAGFEVPESLVVGEEGRSGRALLITRQVDGEMLPRFLDQCGLKSRRETLRALGHEVGRLHRAGLIHGDLTPFNIFVRHGEPARFVFIDHERTGRARMLIGRERRELRNLVQLGHFKIAHIGRTDRMRVFRAWAQARGIDRWRSVMHRAARMLEIRVTRDVARFGLTAIRAASLLERV
ncbi:MAG: hypothetical protein IVW54_07680 [Candidatus Binataceae bacterium]|nr:hypothetical protein [Candidatus Binataceae bacterium]